MSDESRTIVIRDTLSKVYAFDATHFELKQNLSEGFLSIIRKDADETLFGWFARGQWVSAFIVDDDELDEVTGNVQE